VKVLAVSDVANQVTDDDDAYDVDTDVDDAPGDEAESKQKTIPGNTDTSFDHVDAYFSDRQFFLYGDYSTKERLVLSRYIVMFGGIVSMYLSADVRYVLVKDGRWDKHFDEAVEEIGEIDFVRPDWVMRCCDERRRVETAEFLIKQK